MTIEERIKRIDETIEAYDNMKQTSIRIKDWKMRDFYNGCIASLTNVRKELKKELDTNMTGKN